MEHEIAIHCLDCSAVWFKAVAAFEVCRCGSVNLELDPGWAREHARVNGIEKERGKA